MRDRKKIPQIVGHQESNPHRGQHVVVRWTAGIFGHGLQCPHGWPPLLSEVCHRVGDRAHPRLRNLTGRQLAAAGAALLQGDDVTAKQHGVFMRPRPRLTPTLDLGTAVFFCHLAMRPRSHSSSVLLLMRLVHVCWAWCLWAGTRPCPLLSPRSHARIARMSTET